MEDNYLQLAKAEHDSGVYTERDALRVMAKAMVDIAESLRALTGGAGGRAEVQPF